MKDMLHPRASPSPDGIPGVQTVIAADVGELLVGRSSNHAKAALLAVDGRLFQSFKGANPRIILDFGLPVESSLSFFLVAGSEPLLGSEILDDHSQASPFGPKKWRWARPYLVKVNFFLMPERERAGLARGKTSDGSGICAA
jgi:hypothetical protein